ncbi:MAG: hypothetical protein ACK56F_21485, partial [bacterium]
MVGHIQLVFFFESLPRAECAGILGVQVEHHPRRIKFQGDVASQDDMLDPSVYSEGEVVGEQQLRRNRHLVHSHHRFA